MVVNPGLGRERGVPLQQIDGVRVERPSAIELHGAEDIRLNGSSGPPVRPMQAQQLDQAVREAKAQAGPTGH